MAKKKNPFEDLKENMLEKASDWEQELFEKLTSECEQFLANHVIEANQQKILENFRKWMWSSSAESDIFNERQRGIVWQSLSYALINARESIQDDFSGDQDDDEALLEWANSILGND